MFSNNPFAELATVIPAYVMQYFVVAMILLIVVGVGLDMLHKKNVVYFFRNAQKAKKSAKEELSTGNDTNTKKEDLSTKEKNVKDIPEENPFSYDERPYDSGDDYLSDADSILNLKKSSPDLGRGSKKVHFGGMTPVRPSKPHRSRTDGPKQKKQRTPYQEPEENLRKT